MLRKIIFFVLVFSPLAVAQLTQVSGTIKDSSGLPYSLGTISATLVISGTPRFTFNSLPYTPPAATVGLDTTGSFVMSLADVNQLTPSGGTWSFHVCSAQGTVQPGSPITAGPVCFDAPGFIITGTAVNISTQLSAAAPPLSKVSGGGGGTIPIHNQTVSSYHLVLTDNTSLVRMNVATANSVTIDPDSITNFPIGSSITIRQVGTGATSIVAGAGVTITTPSSFLLRVQYASVQVIKVAANTWDLLGDTQ